MTRPRPQRDPDIAGMTLGVYRVRPDGSRITVKATRRVRPSRELPVRLGYPPCSCPRCAPGRR